MSDGKSVCYQSTHYAHLYHQENPSVVTRIDFDCELIIQEIQIGNLIVAVNEKDPMFANWPYSEPLKLENVLCSRYTPPQKLRFGVCPGVRILVKADRPFTFTYQTKF